jgi:hypothetical protein
MLRAEEMLARAKQCDDAADKTDATISAFYRQAAKQWREMAAQLELLEQQQVYRIIRSRPDR